MSAELETDAKESGLTSFRSQPDRRESAAGDLSLLDIVEILLRRARSIIVLAGVVAVVVAALVFVRHRTYTAVATFTPQATHTPGNLSSLAAEFGLSVPMLESGQSPAFYVDLVRSREILSAVVDSTYTVPTDSGAIRETLVDFYHSKGRTRALRIDNAIRQLDQSIDVDASQKTSIVTVSVRAGNAEVAAAIAERIVDELNDFNLRKRASQAEAERKFTEQRVADAQAQLRQAENALESFLQRNRDYENSPQLSFAHDRLAREVSLRQQLYTTLAESLERARIEEVRNTPVITIIQHPEVPVRPDPRRLIVKTVSAFIIGLILGVLFAFAQEFLSRQEATSPRKVRELKQLTRGIIADVKRPWRLVRRRPTQ